MQSFGKWAHMPIFLNLLALISAQLDTGGLSSVPMDTGAKLGALMVAGSESPIEERQTLRCLNRGWVIACPGRALPCAPPGAACCGPLYYYWPETQFCCPDGSGSCALGTVCCSTARMCCKAGAVCAGNRCAWPTSLAPTKTGPTTSRWTSTHTTTTSAKATTSKEITLTTRRVTTTSSIISTLTQTSKTTSSDISETDACSVEINERQVLPVKTIPYVETYTTLPNSNTRVCLDNRELMNSMCKGIKKARGCTSQFMKLTYRPDLAKTNRPTMCPKGFCDDENVQCKPDDTSMPCNPYENFMDIPGGRPGIKWRMTCDEFPFASSLQGGNPGTGTSICIPGWQNSYQGQMLRGLGQMLRGLADKDYIVKITGWDCKTGRPTAGSAQNCGLNSGTVIKRDDLGWESLGQEDFFTNITESGENALMMFLGDVSPGSYTFNLTVASGNLTSILAVDGEGNTFDTSLGNGTLQIGVGLHPVTVQFTEEAYDVALWAYTRETQIQLTYNLTYTAAAATSPSPSPSPSVSMTGGVSSAGGCGGGLALLTACGVLAMLSILSALV